MLTIWGRLNSHNVKKVAWLAEEIGVDYVRHDIGGQFGFTDAYLALNPNKLIPTIEDGDVVLWESNAILRYMAAKYAPHLWPGDPAARAVGDKWMDWQFTYARAQFGAFINLVRRGPDRREHDAIEKAAEATAKEMAILDRYLAETPWLSGESFGIGDIPMGVYTHTWFTLAIDRPEMPHVRGWYERLVERPGFASQVMIPLT